MNELEVETLTNRIGYFRFHIENAKILDRNNNEIKAEDLKVGDTIIIISKPGYMSYFSPPIMHDIKEIRVVYNSAK